MALPKKYRLVDKYDFNRVKRLGRSFSTPFFFLNIASSKNPTHLRFGFVISTKIDKRATVRNRVKRLLSEVVRQYLLDSGIASSPPSPRLRGIPRNDRGREGGFDVVIVAKSAIVGKSLDEVAACFHRVLPKTPLASL